MGKHQICNPINTPKVEAGQGGSSHLYQDVGISQALFCICHCVRQAPLMPWGGSAPQSDPLSKTRSESSLEAFLCLEPQPQPLPLDLVAAVEGVELQALPQSARSAIGRDTIISAGKNPGLPKRWKERQGQQEKKETELWEVEGTHSSLE